MAQFHETFHFIYEMEIEIRFSWNTYIFNYSKLQFDSEIEIWIWAHSKWKISIFISQMEKLKIQMPVTHRKANCMQRSWSHSIAFFVLFQMSPNWL